MLLLQVGGRAAFVGVLSSFFHDGNDNILGATWVALNIHMRTCLKSFIFQFILKIRTGKRNVSIFGTFRAK